MKDVETVPLAELVEDMQFYPRHSVDDTNVQSLALALEAGAVLPAIVADKKSRRIVDGWHRCRAYKRVFGAEAKVPVLFVAYKDELAMIEDAVARNSAHGRRLDVIDQTRSILMLEHYGADSTRIAVALNVTEKRVQKLRIRVARAPTVTAHTAPGTRAITLKQAAKHFAGRRMTAEQAAAHSIMPGTSLVLTARQLREAIDSGLIDLDDEKLLEELRLLSASLSSIDLHPE